MTKQFLRQKDDRRETQARWIEAASVEGMKCQKVLFTRQCETTENIFSDTSQFAGVPASVLET